MNTKLERLLGCAISPRLDNSIQGRLSPISLEILGLFEDFFIAGFELGFGEFHALDEILKVEVGILGLIQRTCFFEVCIRFFEAPKRHPTVNVHQLMRKGHVRICVAI